MVDSSQSQKSRGISAEQLDRLRSAAGSGPVLIVTHDNPDPDALASGKALGTVLWEAWNISTRLIYSGLVARAENRAVFIDLTPEWEFVERLDRLKPYSAVALVDTQPGAGNNSLPGSYIPKIVIDHHHPLREALNQVEFVDVRPEIGATVSLVYQYMEAAGIIPDSDLATAMFYGVQTDTLGLARGTSEVDEAVYIKLLGRLDRRKLIRIEQAGLPRDYFRAFSRGLRAARLFGENVLADLGELHRPDLTAEMADLLIRYEGARAALCLGTYEGILYLSLRTELNQDAGLMVQKIIVPPGKAGGHGRMAGGQVPLDGQDARVVTAEIEHRFLVLIGEPESAGEPLLNV
ncbi:MAG: DHH family phosphoesterase [Anaerolineales bacterium]|jgi:nanoRNase/pAp phosphatase (c-di-AMP/oligoRNAs hydrolase)